MRAASVYGTHRTFSPSADVDAALAGGGAGISTVSGGRPRTYLLRMRREPAPRTASPAPHSDQPMLQTATDVGRRLQCCFSFSAAAACAMQRLCRTRGQFASVCDVER